jgi:hypothetical protein
MKKFLTLLLFCLVININCKKKTQDDPEPPEVDLYTDEQVIGK